jgi:hypothetical protein
MDRAPVARATLSLLPGALVVGVTLLASCAGALRAQPPASPPSSIPSSSPSSIPNSIQAPVRLSQDDWAKLRAGETITRMVPMAGANQRAGIAVRLVPGDPERVARAIGDVDHWSEWVPFLKTSKRSSAPGPLSRELHFDLPWPLSDRHYRAQLRTEAIRAAGGAPGEAGPLEWNLTWDSVPDSGNVEWAWGSFRVTDQAPGRSLVVFRSATDVGAPRFARSILDRVMTDSLSWVLDGLAQQVNRCRYTAPFPAGCDEERPSKP